MLLDTSFPPDSRVENEAVSLIRAGHEVSLFSLDYDSGMPAEERVNGIDVHRFSASQLTYKLSALAYSFPLFRRLVSPLVGEFINRVRPDILHVHDMILGETGLRLARKNKLPCILDLHENRPVIMREYVHVKKFPGNVLINPSRWEKAQKRLVNRADRVIVVTEEAKKQLINDYKKPGELVTVVPNTIHPDIYLAYPVDPRIINPSGEFTLLYMGDTGLRRGTDTAIRALSILRNAGQEVRLVLVGSNTEDVELHKLTESLNLKSHVLFQGWQDVSRFPSYVAVSDLCLSPLKRNLHHDTTYANKIFQYMAMGKPVLVSDCPAQERVIKESHAGLVHRADDPSDMAAKILTLIENPALRKKMGENAASAVQKTWNWQHTSRDLVEMYKSLAKEA